MASILTASTNVGAQPVNERADQLFKQGREQLAADAFSEACLAFEESHTLDPRVTTLINLAGCLEKLGRLATARARFLEAELQTRPESDPAMRQLHKVALDRAFKLEGRVSKLTIRVAAQSEATTLEIARDGKIIPQESWNRELPVDGGVYRISARISGASEWSREVVVRAEGDVVSVEVPDLRPQPILSTPPAEVRQTVPGEVEQSRPHRRSLALPIAVGSTAVALLGGAVGISVWASSTYDDAKSERSDQGRRDALEASANRRRYAAEGAAVAGVACAGVAVWLYLRQRRNQSDSNATMARKMALVSSASGVAVMGWF